MKSELTSHKSIFTVGNELMARNIIICIYTFILKFENNQEEMKKSKQSTYMQRMMLQVNLKGGNLRNFEEFCFEKRPSFHL